MRFALEAGGKGLHLHCPWPKCDEPVTGDAWAAWLPSSAAPLHTKLTLRAFVEGNALLAWCPGAGCGASAAPRTEAVRPRRSPAVPRRLVRVP